MLNWKLPTLGGHDGPVSSRGFPHSYLMSQLQILDSQNQVLQSFACTVPSSFQWLTPAYLECMYLVIVIMIRLSGTAESAEINSFFTISIAPTKSWCHHTIHTWIIFQGTTLQTWIIIDHLFPLHWAYSGPVWQLSIVLLLSTVW